MCDSAYDSSSCSSDNETNNNGGKTKLTCSLYEFCGGKKDLELKVNLEELDVNNLTLTDFDENKCKVLYNGNKLRIFMNSFDGVVRKSRVFETEKNIKVKTEAVRKKLWEVFLAIEQLLKKATLNEKKFCWFCEWYIIFINFYEKRLITNHIYHFENIYVAIDDIILFTINTYDKCFRLITELIETDITLPGSCYSEYKKGRTNSLLN